MLTKEQAYLAVFRYLYKAYEETNDESLMDLLGSMNPYLFKGAISADPAVWFDWLENVEKVTSKDKITSSEAFQAMTEFLNFYQEEFGDDFTDIMKKYCATEDNEFWLACIDNVKAKK